MKFIDFLIVILLSLSFHYCLVADDIMKKFTSCRDEQSFDYFRLTIGSNEDVLGELREFCGDNITITLLTEDDNLEDDESIFQSSIDNCQGQSQINDSKEVFEVNIGKKSENGKENTIAREFKYYYKLLCLNAKSMENAWRTIDPKTYMDEFDGQLEKARCPKCECGVQFLTTHFLRYEVGGTCVMYENDESGECTWFKEAKRYRLADDFNLPSTDEQNPLSVTYGRVGNLKSI